MIKRLKLFKNEAENDLKSASIDKTHQKIKFAQVRKIFRCIENRQYLKNLFQCLKTNLKSQNNQIKVKSLILLHYLIRKSDFRNQIVLQFTQKQLNQLKIKKATQNGIIQSFSLGKSKSKIQVQNQQKAFIQKNIIQFYTIYLLKFIISQQSYLYAKETTETNESTKASPTKKQTQKHLQKTTCQTKIQRTFPQIIQRRSIMQQINHGFHIINLVNFILQSQQGFNKMGRYYRDQEQILDLFLMYLDDITIYNHFIKKIANIITKSITELPQEQVKHCFLFITESQKTSDRLYQFYYNRYYYQKVKKLISMPTFLNIDSNDFQRVSKQVKKVDRELFTVVNQSKYSQQYRMNKTMMCLTEGNNDQHSRDSISLRKINRTMKTQIKEQFNNKTLMFEYGNNKNRLKEEENITRFIECFEDVDDLGKDTEEYQGMNEDFI